MAKIERSEVLEKLQEGLRLNTAREKTPTEVADKVLAVFKVNPDHKIQVRDVQTPSTIITTSTIKRTFLIGCQLGVIKDTSATSVLTAITGTAQGVVTRFLQIPSITLTAQSEVVGIIFNKPIELDKGTTVTLANSTAVAVISSAASIYFYEVEE